MVSGFFLKISPTKLFFFFFFVAAKAFVVVCMDSRPHAVSRSVVGVHSLSFPSREASLLWKEDS